MEPRHLYDSMEPVPMAWRVNAVHNSRVMRHQAQNGFVVGRNGLDNIVTIDAQARTMDHHVREPISSASDLAVLALYDFKAAFPSIVHKFIFMVL